MANIIKHKLLFINNFNILIFNYKQLITIFKEIDDLIEYNYNKNHNILFHYQLNLNQRRSISLNPELSAVLKHYDL